MEKLDYSDINKFLASLGVVLMGIGFLLPYFYLKEDFGLLVKATDFNGLLPGAQSIISNRYFYLEKLRIIIPILSALLLLSGIISFCIGIIRWNKNQKQLDEKLKIDIEKTRQEVINLTPLTPKETEENAKNEVQEEVKESTLDTQKPNIYTTVNYSERVNSYIRIEKTIADLFTAYNHSDHVVSSQQRIDNRMNIDVLLQSKTSSVGDAIVEIKYFQTLSLGLVKRIADTINTNTAYYKNKTGKFTIPVLIIVTKNKNTPEEISKFKDIIIKYKIGLPDIEEMIVEIITEEEMSNLDIKGILGEIKNRSQLQLLHQHFLNLSK